MFDLSSIVIPYRCKHLLFIHGKGALRKILLRAYNFSNCVTGYIELHKNTFLRAAHVHTVHPLSIYRTLENIAHLCEIKLPKKGDFFGQMFEANLTKSAKIN